MTTRPITLALTGASGMAYGLRLLECLIRAQREVYVLISKPARMVMELETPLNLPAGRRAVEAALRERYNARDTQLKVFSDNDWMAPPASGSAQIDAMVVCPCTMATLSALAQGGSRNLIERAGDVALKERRKLIIVPRESPLSAIHLQNMLTLTHAGATILPANPGFYHNPETLNDLVDFIVARILDQLNIAHTLTPPWGQDNER